MQRPLVPPSSYTLMSNAVAAGNSLKAALSLPVTKVFVGNISERVPDPMMRAILQRCGSVISWKRVEGPSGKLQAFGFCEYDNPQSTLRCIRLLNGYEIAEKKLLVKVDQKTRELLGEYIKKNLDKSTKNAKKAATIRNYSKNRAGEDGELDDDDTKEINLEAADEDTHKEDRIVLNALELILRQYHKDLVPQPPPAAIPVQPATPTVTTTPTTPVTETTPKTVDSPLKTTDESANSTLPSNKLVTNDKDLTATRSKSIDKQKERDRDRDRRPRDLSPVNDRYRGRNNSRSIERDSVKTNKPYHNSRSR
jgi:RNA-binding protein 25